MQFVRYDFDLREMDLRASATMFCVSSASYCRNVAMVQRPSRSNATATMEVRLIDFSQGRSIADCLFWLELYCHMTRSSLDSCRCARTLTTLRPLPTISFRVPISCTTSPSKPLGGAATAGRAATPASNAQPAGAPERSGDSGPRVGSLPVQRSECVGVNALTWQPSSHAILEIDRLSSVRQRSARSILNFSKTSEKVWPSNDSRRNKCVRWLSPSRGRDFACPAFTVRQ